MINISEAAARAIQQMREDESADMKLRIGVKGGGCTGLSYGMGFDNEVTEEDQELEIHGLPIVVDKESAGVLEGVEIDYKENMMGGGFTIENPNAVATCGCGTSFKTATRAGTPEDC
ncbi:iron-sulfur cluster assembly protein [Salsuginibacillus halophilus]|uniref:Iron-sulfur cluster assembly protein n=1 Tax=Salsuginibacillus halophilus TaxID=517424 RepID=A0A2P8HE19_9BACI|nr:iron-sulfur cluster assembly accessory protein [Salsuginibacillus halophilus]PSL44463.1 iron-sulfur cluster assembly protein [Salsuginibacillus halophilus]